MPFKKRRVSLTLGGLWNFYVLFVQSIVEHNVHILNSFSFRSRSVLDIMVTGKASKRRYIEEILSDRHAILRFNKENEEAKFKTLANKTIMETYHLQPNHMNNMRQWLEEKVPVQWRRVFEIDCVPYRELVLEFFSTFSIHPDISDMNLPTMVFKLGGKMRTASIREFAQRLGIYTADEMEHGMLGNWYEITNQQIFAFWKGLVKNRHFKLKYMHDTQARILYQIISASLFGHREFEGNLSHTDLRIMYSILTNKYLCPAMYIAKSCMEKFPGTGKVTTISGGKIVTKLAESYNLLTPDFVTTLYPIGKVFVLNVSTGNRLPSPDEPEDSYWMLLHDAPTSETLAQETPIVEANVVNNEPGVDQINSVGVMEPWTLPQGGFYFQGESSSVQDIPSFQTLFQLQENPSADDPLDIPNMLMPEMPQNFPLTSLFTELSPNQNFFQGEPSSQIVTPTFLQDIPQSSPVVQPAPTSEDVVKELREIKEVLVNLTVWLKNRFPDS